MVAVVFNMMSLILLLLLCTSCTISIILTDTHGSATDVVDSTPKIETKTDADVDIPLSPV